MGGSWARARPCLNEQQRLDRSTFKALQSARRSVSGPELALIRLDLAELLLARFANERAQAFKYLDVAMHEPEAMRMQPGLERALALAQPPGAQVTITSRSLAERSGSG